MTTTPKPSKMPCQTFRPGHRSKFCAVCGHTGARHPLDLPEVFQREGGTRADRLTKPQALLLTKGSR